MESAPITPRRNLDARVSIPGSKSCTARALIMAALTHGSSTLLDPADCDDSDYMITALQGLGVPVRKEPQQVHIEGRAFTPPAAPLFLGNSGTAMRFLSAACATLQGRVVLDGNPRMRERPILDLAEALRHWDVNVSLPPSNCPPVTITATGAFGGATRIKGSASSQYLSGLLMAAPRAARPVEIAVDGDLVSKPYIDLTLVMMHERGVAATHDNYARFYVPSAQAYAPGTYAIEADASGASYFLAAAAIAGGRVRVGNLTRTSHQGDAQFASVLEQMGCLVVEGPDWLEVQSGATLSGIEIDLNAMPDMAQTLAVTALFAEGPTCVRNVANLRIKECDRIDATVRELRKLGAYVEEFDDGFRITPGQLHAGAIDTYDDHRMAMSFALAGLRIPGVVINDPGCVSKTFPDFFQRFAALT